MFIWLQCLHLENKVRIKSCCSETLTHHPAAPHLNEGCFTLHSQSCSGGGEGPARERPFDKNQCGRVSLRCISSAGQVSSLCWLVLIMCWSELESVGPWGAGKKKCTYKRHHLDQETFGDVSCKHAGFTGLIVETLRCDPQSKLVSWSAAIIHHKVSQSLFVASELSAWHSWGL